MVKDRNWVLNPSDFAFLWEECQRCFYLKVVHNFRRPKLSMPRIFTLIDSQMKANYAGKETRDVMPFLPSGTIDPSASSVQSLPLSVLGHHSTCTIRGKLDTVVRFDDQTFAVIDFKTSGSKSEHVSLYGRQLHAYALALENAATGKLALRPVTTLGLLVFEPSGFVAIGSSEACLNGSVKWLRIPRDDSKFLAFLGNVLDVLDAGVPPDASVGCEWCKYRMQSRETGL
jgi:hypothetical protein